MKRLAVCRSFISRSNGMGCPSNGLSNLSQKSSAIPASAIRSKKIFSHFHVERLITNLVRADEDNAQDVALRAMEECIRDVRNWLIDGRLLLIDNKTEFLVIGTRQQLNKLSPLSLQVGDHNIDPSLNARNLEAIINNSLSMNNHINQICKPLSSIILFIISVEFLNFCLRNAFRH